MGHSSRVVLRDNYVAAGTRPPGNREAGRWAALAGSGLLVAGLAACSAPVPFVAPDRTLVTAEVEAQIEEGLVNQVGGEFSVSCPARIPAEAGYAFSCEVIDRTGGRTVSVRVEEDGDEGAFTWTVVEDQG